MTRPSSMYAYLVRWITMPYKNLTYKLANQLL